MSEPNRVNESFGDRETLLSRNNHIQTFTKESVVNTTDIDVPAESNGKPVVK